MRAFGKANSEKPVAAHSCLVRCFEYGAMKWPLDTNNKKNERRCGGRAEGHLAKPTALKASRHGVAFVTSAAPAHSLFCVWGNFGKIHCCCFLWPSQRCRSRQREPMAAAATSQQFCLRHLGRT